MILLHYRTETGPRLAVRRDGETLDAGVTLDDIFAGEQPRPGGQPLDAEALRLAPCT